MFSFFLYSFLANEKIKVKRIILSISICLIFACLDEFYQSFIPFRSSGLFDVLIDFSGANTSIFFILLIKLKNLFD
jgi:VanZ family protein